MDRVVFVCVGVEPPRVNVDTSAQNYSNVSLEFLGWIRGQDEE